MLPTSSGLVLILPCIVACSSELILNRTQSLPLLPSESDPNSCNRTRQQWKDPAFTARAVHPKWVQKSKAHRDGLAIQQILMTNAHIYTVLEVNSSHHVVASYEDHIQANLTETFPCTTFFPWEQQLGVSYSVYKNEEKLIGNSVNLGRVGSPYRKQNSWIREVNWKSRSYRSEFLQWNWHPHFHMARL